VAAGFIDWATFQANQARLDSNRGVYGFNVGGLVIEQGVANALLEAVTLTAVDAIPDAGYFFGKLTVSR
jgi:hypothetical protein